jgi:hypothetical protein
MPRLTAPTWWPARPMRWSPDATELGASTWMTRSTAPMSMPSSSELVATTAGSRPALRSSSISVRCSRLTEPWWARASSVSASSLRLAHSRSARRRELANTMVERWARISSTSRSSMWGQMEERSGTPEADPDAGSSDGSPMAAMSSTGTTTARSNAFSLGGATTLTGRGPPRKRATSSSGRTVADRPMRRAGRSSSSSRRSRLRARWAPRLVATTEWTSSTITVSTWARASRALEVSSRNSDSGVVMRMSGGWAGKRRRASAGVSPVRIPTVMSGRGSSRRAAAARRPARGARRLRSMSAARALSGETYRTRRRSRSGTAGAPARRSMADRNAARVLPDPVGATTSTSWSWARASQAPVWAWVGAAKAPSNQPRVRAENRPSPSGGGGAVAIPPC